VDVAAAAASRGQPRPVQAGADVTRVLRDLSEQGDCGAVSLSANSKNTLPGFWDPMYGVVK
jgi:hypothetical protein